MPFGSPSSSIVIACVPADGSVLVCTLLSVTVAVDVSPSPSLMVYWKLAVPLKPGVGV